MIGTTVEAASAEQVSALAAFVPSRYRARLVGGTLAAELRLVGAWNDGVPVGAGLASLRRGGASCESLCVLPGLRRRGIGRALLAALEHACTEAGSTTMAAVLPDGERFRAIRALLSGGGWAPPRLRHRQFEIGDGIRASATLAAPHDLSAYDVIACSGLTARDRRAIQRIAAAIPSGLDPLRDEDRIIDEASLFLRRGTEIVAWGLSQHFAPGTSVVPTVWVAPSERGGGLGALLGLLAIRAALDVGYERVRFVVDADNTAMIRIVEREVVPYGSTEINLLETTRSLRAAS